jgi:hypothetical protein
VLIHVQLRMQNNSMYNHQLKLNEIRQPLLFDRLIKKLY